MLFNALAGPNHRQYDVTIQRAYKEFSDAFAREGENLGQEGKSMSLSISQGPVSDPPDPGRNDLNPRFWHVAQLLAHLNLLGLGCQHFFALVPSAELYITTSLSWLLHSVEPSSASPFYMLLTQSLLRPSNFSAIARLPFRAPIYLRALELRAAIPPFYHNMATLGASPKKHKVTIVGSGNW